MFDAVKVKNDCVQWIRDWFEVNGKGCNAVIGISGGKDSTVAAALCVEALGKDRVVGIMMPNGHQSDLNDAKAVCNYLNITNSVINIEKIVDICLVGTFWALGGFGEDPSHDAKYSDQTKINLPPRIRMTMLYAISQSMNGRVVNTCNLSEDYVGYSTRWGDSVGDFSPLANLTTDEVIAIGDALGLPYDLVHKTPADGLCGKTDEDNLGFTYTTLNKYIRTGVCEDEAVKARIDELHQKNLFKLQPMPSFPYNTNTIQND